MIDNDHPLTKTLRLRRFTCTGTCAVVAAAGWILMGQALGQTAPKLPAVGDGSIQETLDANPGQMIYVPPGDFEISQKLRLIHDRSGLFGPGRIIQTNPDVPIIEIERATGVRLRDLTLSRADGRMQTSAEGILARECRDLVIEDVQVLDNRTSSAAIVLRQCRTSQVRSCLVRNYMRISVDDRTGSEDWGYAFHCIDGTGIAVHDSQATLIQASRVIEENLLPTPENKQKFHLGAFVKKNPQKGLLLSQKVWDEEYVNNWHQGSAIVVTGPESSDGIQILGNYIENAAQGIDIHADHVTVSQNIVNNAFMGMKAMHGSRHVLILGNQFMKNDLWSIGLMPGAASHAAQPGQEAQLAVQDNGDGGSIIAHNIISQFGYGHAHWIWGSDGTPLRFDAGQQPDDPPLSEVIVQGNLVYDTGRDQPAANGQASTESPRYVYAVRVSADAKGLHFSNNLFHPGTGGISNVELPP
jgi:hypothetical protein